MSDAAVTKKESETKRVRALVDRAQKGDRGALEELYLIHFDRIYSYLHVSVGNRHDAEDLTTQTFLKMLEAIGKFRWQSAPFSAWLFRIAHNLAMDHFRANKRWQPEEEVPEPEPDEATSAEAGALESIGRFRWQAAPFSAWLFRIAHNLSMDHFRSRRRWQPEEEVPEPHGSEEPSAELEAMQSIGRQSMLELIDTLSPEQQQVLTLKFVFNFPNADVAKILDKTEGAIKSLQHRALASLQKQIQDRPE